jgi:lysozyme
MEQEVTDALSLFVDRAVQEEGKRPLAYNDASGKTVTCKTMDPPGNLSIGIGVNLEVGLDDEEIAWLLSHCAGKVYAALQTYPFWHVDESVRGSVLVDLGFNAGLVNLLHFVHMLAAYEAKDWQGARDELLDSSAARELPSRYNMLAQLLLNGA